MRDKQLTYVPTGEVRPPREGEWFAGHGGFPMLAWFNHSTEHPILEQRIVDEDDAKLTAAAGG